MLSTSDTERLVQCPYEKSHMILHYRFQTHLCVCRKQHPNTVNVDCPFNYSHKIPEPELNYHIENCPDRIAIDLFSYKTDNVSLVPPIPEINIPALENWDDENTPTYNAIEASKLKPIIRTDNQNLSAAQQRKFKLEERHRMSKLMAHVSEPAPQPFVPERNQNLEANRRPHARSSLMQAIEEGANSLVAPRVGSSIEGASEPRDEFPPLMGVNRPREDAWQQVKPKGRGRGHWNNKK